MCSVGTILFTIFALIILYPAAARNREGFVADGSLPKLIQAASRLNRDYVIESVTMVVQMDVIGSEPGKTVAAEVRINYGVFALRKVVKFDEEFHSSVANVRVDRIHGSDSETELNEIAPDHKRWDVTPVIEQGQRRSIVTGAKYTYTLPFPDKRRVHDFGDLGPLDDAWCYPNVEDVIGELTIIVESYRPIKSPSDEDLLLVDKSDPDSRKRTFQKGRPVLQSPDSGSSAPYVLVGRWTNVMPNQYCEIRLSRE